MKKIFFLLLAFSIAHPSYAHSFRTKVNAEVTKYTNTEVELKVTKHRKENEETFPVGTVIHGNITEHKPNRRCYRDESIKLQLDKATLPDGSVVQLNQSMKIRPRKFLNPQMVGIGAIATTGGVLGLTISMLSLGLPIVRGGLAIWDAGYEVYDKPIGGSTWKAAGKGFLDGALFPIPQIFLKSRRIGMENGTEVVVYPAKNNKTVYVSVPRKNTRIEKHRGELT